MVYNRTLSCEPQSSTRARLAPAFILPLLLTCPVLAQTSNVLTGQYNNSRSGANLHETILTPAAVSATTFGLLFAQTVDGNLLAQPLYVQGLTIANALHNVVFAATSNDSVYAFDADTYQPALWHMSLGTPVKAASGVLIGIVSTPVIDTALNALFVVSYTVENSTLVYRLHALDLQTGADMANVIVQGAVPGTGDDSQTTTCLAAGGTAVQPPCVPFVASEVMQRPGLLEDTAHATIYLAFGVVGGNEATRLYHGWLIGYRYAAGVFSQSMIFNTTQNATQTGFPCTTPPPPSNQCGHGGGIWMSGRGPALDNTGIYAVSGNGGYGGIGTGNWSESALRLSGAGVVKDFFTPNNYSDLNARDLDLGNAGPILFNSANTTAPHLLVTAGKAGMVYLLDRASLGRFSSSNSGVVQMFPATPQGCGTGPGQSLCYEVHSTALWARTNAAPLLYIWPYGDMLRVWDFDATTNQFAPDANTGALPAPYFPGGGLAVSADGNSNGIVWGIVPVTNTYRGQGMLYAFDATNVAKQLFASTDYWFATKFTIPTVANGKVYVPTSASPPSVTPVYLPQLRVYGPTAVGQALRLPSHKRHKKSQA